MKAEAEIHRNSHDGVENPRPQSVLEIYQQRTEFMRSSLTVYPSEFESHNMLRFVGEIENSIIGQVKDPNRFTVVVSTGLPGSSKSLNGKQIKSYMFDPDTGRVHNMLKHAQRGAKYYQEDFGEAIFTLPQEYRVDGDYHADRTLLDPKRSEYRKGTTNLYGMAAYTMAKVQYGDAESDIFHYMEIDDPLLVGFSELDENGNVQVDETGKEQVVGKPAGDKELWDLVHKKGRFADLNYDVFVLGMVATEEVYRHAENVRNSVAEVGNLKNAIQLLRSQGIEVDHDETPESVAKVLRAAHPYVIDAKLDKLKEYGVNILLDRSEAERYVSNVARPETIRLARLDAEEVMMDLINKGQIKSGRVAPVTRRMIQNIPEIRDEMLAETMKWYLTTHLDVPRDRGIILQNSRISPITVAEPSFPHEYIRPMDALKEMFK